MKRIILAITGLALMGAFVLSCEKPEPEPEKVELKAPVISAVADGTTVSVSWASVTNATGYKVEYKKSTDSEFAVSGTPTYSPYQVTGLEFGLSYDFRVKATCGESESPYSNVVTVDVVRYLPSPVIQVTSGIGFLNVVWEPIEGAASYQVEHRLSIDSEFKTDASVTETSYRITGLESGVSYDVRVGVIADGYSMAYSEIKTVATTAAASNSIGTAAQLVAWLNSISDDTRDVTAITNDIDMSGVSITSASGFSGTLAGQGFAIKNLKSSVPIFASNSGTVSDLVIDESCEFTAGSNVFGALAGKDNHGNYVAVKNHAKVVFKSDSDVTAYLAIGGLVGESVGGNFTNCSNSGAISIEAAGHSHQASGLGGIVGYAEGATFESCINRGPVTLIADYGNPRTKLAGRDNEGINVGGILGCGQDVSGDNYCVFNECQNETGGVITLNHTKINGLKDEDNAGIVGVGGITGRARGDATKCKNWGPIKVTATSSDREGVKLRNYVIHVGGIAGVGYWGLGFEGCANEADITAEYDGTYMGNRIHGAVGGICGRENPDDDSIEGHAGSYAYYCKNKGSITVNGKGSASAGGIFGIGGKQIGNQVTEECKITYVGFKGSIGGLTGYVDGAVANCVVRACSCAATIKADNFNGDDEEWLAVGGLLGRWGGANTSGYPAYGTRDEVPCTFKGSVSSSTLNTSVGLLFGDIRGEGKTIEFGEASGKIQASGTIAKKDLPAVTISPDNVDTYAVGHIQSGANVTIHVEYSAD